MEANVTHKANLFARDSAGRTSLFYAAERGDLEEVRRMIYSLAGTGLWCQRLALIETRDSSGLTASDVAEHAGHKEIADLLRGEQMRMEFFE
jgi:ankyrin repeat protein